MSPKKTTAPLPPGRSFRYSRLEFPPCSGIKEMEFHKTAHFGVIFWGDQNFRMPGGSRILRAGDIYLIAPWEVHFRWSSSRLGCRQFEMDFEPDELLRLILDASKTLSALFHLTSSTRHALLNSPAPRKIARNFAEHLLQMQQDDNEFSPARQWLTISEMMLEIIAAIDRQSFPAEELSKYERVRPAIDRLSECKRLPFSDAAAECALSRSRFSHLFSEVFGIPYSDYERLFRLNLAAMDMLGRRLDVSEAAVEWGFCDPSHFVRLFRANFGLTPGKYLKEFPSY